MPELLLVRGVNPVSYPEEGLLVVTRQSGEVLWQRPVGSDLRVVSGPTEPEVAVLQERSAEFAFDRMGAVVASDKDGTEMWRNTSDGKVLVDWSVGSKTAYSVLRNDGADPHNSNRFLASPGLHLLDRQGTTIGTLKEYAFEDKVQRFMPLKSLTLRNSHGARFLVTWQHYQRSSEDQFGVLMVYNEQQQAVYAEVLAGSCGLGPALGTQASVLLQCNETMAGKPYSPENRKLFDYTLP